MRVCVTHFASPVWGKKDSRVVPGSSAITCAQVLPKPLPTMTFEANNARERTRKESGG